MKFQRECGEKGFPFTVGETANGYNLSGSQCGELTKI